MKNNFPTFSPIFDRGTIYLGFLLFESNDLNEAVSFIRDACSKSKNPSSEIMSFFSKTVGASICWPLLPF